jgi:hypothetical protein
VISANGLITYPKLNVPTTSVALAKPQSISKYL